ncbi:hypothetical protein PoB_003669300 [Plakobranchus ocellatus]|uniref:Uncharacterized protein n=1 Tax=Plakobranchus ocellatus TaxID=259542 RepID=A0AAV4ATP6_9GAST|nr:hypothetical protein PoB_003669300 [Plakobranchus ocellatus]
MRTSTGLIIPTNVKTTHMYEDDDNTCNDEVDENVDGTLRHTCLPEFLCKLHVKDAHVLWNRLAMARTRITH